MQARPAGLRVAALPLALQPPRPGRTRRLPAQAGGVALLALPRPAADGEAVLDPRLRGHAAGRGADRVRDLLRHSPTAPCPSRPARSGTLEPAGEGEECDVVIVGSGAGGAVAAATLAEAGLDVLVLEAGEHYNRESYPSDHLEAIANLYRDAGLTIAEGRPPIPVPVAKVVGGTTVINSGTCFRAPDAVLEDWRAPLRDRVGGRPRRRLRRGRGVPPRDPARPAADGPQRPAGDGRSAPALGASGAPIFRNAGRCTQCSSCPFGCAIDAKRGMHVSYLPARRRRRGAAARRGRSRPRHHRGRARGRGRVPARGPPTAAGAATRSAPGAR